MRTERGRTELGKSRSCTLTERAVIEGPEAVESRDATDSFLSAVPKWLEERIGSDNQICGNPMFVSSGATPDVLLSGAVSRALLD